MIHISIFNICIALFAFENIPCMYINWKLGHREKNPRLMSVCFIIQKVNFIPNGNSFFFFHLDINKMALYTIYIYNSNTQVICQDLLL